MISPLVSALSRGCAVRRLLPYCQNAFTQIPNRGGKSSFQTPTLNQSRNKMTFGHDDSGTETTETIMMDLCLIPLGMLSVSKEIAEVEKILRDPSRGLTVQLHAYGSNIQGEWDDVMAALKECHKVLHNKHDVVRISSSIRMGTRIDRKQTIDDKIKSVTDKL